MSRRALLPRLLAGTAIAIPAADSPLAVASGGGPVRAGRWRLVYVGADDCAPCRQWRDAHWSAVRHATAFSAIAFVEVRAPRAADLLRDEYWPAALRPLRAEIPKGAGVPLWLLVEYGTVAARAWGEAGWRDNILPALRRAASARIDPSSTPLISTPPISTPPISTPLAGTPA